MADLAPFVGPPTEATGCAYAPDIDQPYCERPPSVHVLSDAPGWGPVALAACAEHAPTARQAGTLVGEHPYGPGCERAECWP